MHTIKPKRENRQIEKIKCINVTIRPNDKPCYDSEIRMFSKYRDRQMRISLVSNTTSSWSKYNRLGNKVNNLKKFAKQHFFTNIENYIENLNRK